MKQTGAAFGLLAIMARRSVGSWSWRWGFWTQASLFILLLVSALLVLIGRNNETEMSYSGARELADDVASPAMVGVSWPMAGWRKAEQWAGSWINSAAKVRRLEEENRNLRQWEALSHALHGKIVQYEQLLNMAKEPGLQITTARLVAETQGPFVRSALLRAGMREGVMDGHAVVVPDGMIGRIVTSGQTSSRVLMLSDLNSRIPVRFDTSNARAILAGDNQSKPKLLYISNKYQPESGERISTSGDDGILPAGIAIGTVSQLATTEENGLATDIRVDLFADLASLDFVQVLGLSPVASPDPLATIEETAAQ